MVFEPYEKFPWTEIQQQFSDATDVDITDWPDRLNFSRVHFKSVPTERLRQEVRSRSVDGGRASRGSVNFDQLPPGYKQVDIRGLYGWSFVFNFWDSGLDAWRDVNVRKAIAHVLDRKSLAVQLMNEEARPDELLTGMTRSQEDEWLDSSFKETLDPYDRNPKKAAQYLKQSGYTKRSGKWYKPNGDRFVAKFKTATGISSYANAFQVAASNLEQFGIKTNVEFEEQTTYFSKQPNDRGYQIGVGPNYGGAGIDAYGAFDFVYRKVRVSKSSGEADYLAGRPDAAGSPRR
jgi:ABC-type transport system substrate-binding protein